ncbi:hypothetical protein P2E05_13675 [Providencia stuartii]|uniref:hypothetical protein n=1 Tax=Providencia TaxID=586 RepID=UPI0012B52E6B|nr:MULTISPECIES: hypothetical protein [Providencia]ELR5143093.1 hypothetical protein [Providencia stuartii]MTB41591.1 hypothetical protein [Providencia sp. wls1949]MTC09530.1 hypothetical protein [Providencia sp. wls1948]WER21142.1 hypothetical protein P2E04_13670 [Providencia stuartii]WER25262.1 hypothetical protein P2E05_13675 [Providencia stuartii]
MEKKNHPLQVASQDNATASILSKNPPKKIKAWKYFLSAYNGSTENDILKYCRLSSGRNYFSELERKLNINLERTDEPNPDGIGSHYRYRIRNQKDAKKIIDLINSRACAGGYDGISIHQSDLILSLYPVE